jgi:type 1 glutamine amidotransferase
MSDPACTSPNAARRHRRATLALAPLVVLAAWAGLAAGLPEPPTPDPKAAPAAAKERLLVFSKTAGFRHDSSPDGIACVRELLGDRYEIDASEDAAVFTPSNLARYRAVVFLSTTGDILDADQQKAFEGYIHLGGGFAGIHAAADTEHTWPWYGRLVGAYFKTHPDIQEALVRVEDRTHPSTAMLPAEWRRTDEWYVYKSNPRGSVKVLANLDTSTIRGETMGNDHPIAWFHEFEGGRAWYTGGGHTKESFKEPLFRAHIRGGVLWAAGAEPAPVAKPVDSDAQPSAPSADPAVR